MCDMERHATNQPYLAPEKNGFSQDRLVTIADLAQLRIELLQEMKHLLSQKQTAPEKQWLKTGEVQKLLQVSPGTLQHLRDTGQIPFTKLGGIIYYDYAVLKEMLAKR